MTRGGVFLTLEQATTSHMSGPQCTALSLQPSTSQWMQKLSNYFEKEILLITKTFHYILFTAIVLNFSDLWWIYQKTICLILWSPQYLCKSVHLATNWVSLVMTIIQKVGHYPLNDVIIIIQVIMYTCIPCTVGQNLHQYKQLLQVTLASNSNTPLGPWESVTLTLSSLFIRTDRSNEPDTPWSQRTSYGRPLGTRSNALSISTKYM